MNERHDGLQEIIGATPREMAAQKGDGFDPQSAENTRRSAGNGDPSATGPI